MNNKKLSSGIQLAYQDKGSGLPIVLVHGWGVSGSLFAPQMDELCKRFRVIVPDMPGHGGSDPFPVGERFSFLAAGLAELITYLQLKSLVLVGWSMGAMIAWDLLKRFPEIDVAGLVSVDMSPRVLNGPDWTYGLRAGVDRHVFDRHMSLMCKDWPAFTDLFMTRMFARHNNGRNAGLMTQTRKAAQANDPQSMAAIWAEMVEQDFRADLARFDLPGLVVAGRKSLLYRMPASHWVAAQMPQARLVEFQQSGHAPNMEEPERFNTTLSGFVDGITASKAQEVNTLV